MHATPRNCMQQHVIATQQCDMLLSQLLLRTPHRPETCGQKPEVLTKNATIRNCILNNKMRCAIPAESYLPLEIAAGENQPPEIARVEYLNWRLTPPLRPGFRGRCLAPRNVLAFLKCVVCSYLLVVAACCVCDVDVSKDMCASFDWTQTYHATLFVDMHLHCHWSVHVWHLAKCPHHD